MTAGAFICAILLSLGSRLSAHAAESVPGPGPKVHEIEATDWGVSPPAGFIPAEGMPGAWKPSPTASRRGQPLARNSLIRVYSAFSAEACQALCAGQPVPPDKVSGNMIRGKPADSYQCRETVFHLGMAWPQSDFIILHLDENACAILALLARSGEARRQALPAFAGLRASLAPLPKGSLKPAADDEAAGKMVPMLR